MAEQTLVQFRVDKELKQNTTSICDSLGIDLTTVLRMCMKQMEIVRGIPFPTRLPDIQQEKKPMTREEALKAFYELREWAADLPEMTLDEINAEIAASRVEKKARKAPKTTA
ncbi:MAG: type II toxin-antitoxin system RelB/DinJ family antitoxin [Lachnospiraceae bacterium]|nr:type II toxin-antitoxin system RelB/DinJ family antitoxin [Lachnospiraceae bacterium]